jgi:hypothetical protein
MWWRDASQEGSTAFLQAVLHERQAVIQALIEHGSVRVNEANRVRRCTPRVVRVVWDRVGWRGVRAP